jgi:two-component system sensor histidine kinase KdpD
VYDFLFVDPRHTLVVADPGEWLNLLLLLFVGVVVGRLTAAQRDRADSADTREREARALFRLSRTIALAPSIESALPDILGIVVAETRFSRVWVMLGGRDADERIAADSGTGAPPAPSVVAVLHRRPGDEPAEWSLVHYPRPAGRPRGTEEVAHRVFVETAGRRLGSVWALRSRESDRPSRQETRLLSAAADQVGQAFERDHLAQEAVSAEIARRSDNLKSALLDSVSHDLRTPLASIRAAAGSLIDPAVSWTPEEVRASAETIDQEAERLARLVTALLDLSRIEAGELRAELRPLVPAEGVGDAVGRLAGALGARSVEVDVPDDLPLVLVDEVFLEQTIGNVLENVALHTPPDARVLVRARVVGDPALLRLEIADAGPGVAPEAMARLFDKFYRVDRAGAGARRGSGIGLAIARGLVEAMGGTIEASPSELGGLSIAISLPTVAARPTEESRDVPADRLTTERR